MPNLETKTKTRIIKYDQFQTLVPCALSIKIINTKIFLVYLAVTEAIPHSRLKAGNERKLSEDTKDRRWRSKDQRSDITASEVEVYIRGRSTFTVVHQKSPDEEAEGAPPHPRFHPRSECGSYVMNEAAVLLAGGLNSTVSTLLAGLRVAVGAAASLVPLPEASKLPWQPSIGTAKDTVLSSLSDLVWWLELTPLQSHALKSLLIILLINLILIFVSWHVYAHRISHTLSFNSLRIVEDILKKNTNFKLPKDNSARI